MSHNSIFCRVCGEINVERFEYNHLIFPGKTKEWTNVYCQKCCAVSHYKSKGSYQDYINAYRTRPGYNLDFKPPVDPWAQVTFDRSIHIISILEKNKIIIEDNLLDLGGYNGFLSYGLSKRFNLNVDVADLDQNGLQIARSLGLKTINLESEKIRYEKYQSVILVHVLEHIEDPKELIDNMAEKLEENTLIYIEVPNVYGFPLCDPAHVTSFSKQALSKFMQHAGFSLVDQGFISTPASSFKYGYWYESPEENIYFLGRYKGIKKNIQEKNPNLQEFMNKLDFSYNSIGIKYMHGRILKNSLRLLIRSIYIFLISLISFSFMRIFLVNLRNSVKKMLG